MADFQRVVEFLRDVRQGPLQAVTPDITQLSAEYAALCVLANERLRKCSTFLQQGLRSEAIHLAEETPNLLDLVAALDLPDQQAWTEFCQNNGLAVPPPLQMERAAQLNDAYAQDQPLEHLLSQHRLLALSRAPVRERLGVMRRIAQVEGGNSHWEKDIRTFEKARLLELPGEFLVAVKSRDDKTVAGLMEEVRQSWYEPVPAELVGAIGDAYARMHRAGVEVELRKLVEPLREAYAARSLQECQALVARWKHLMAAGAGAAGAGGTGPVNGTIHIAPELLDEIRPVVAFITEQTRQEDHARRFRESCKTFTAMLDRDEPDAQLEAGFARLKEFNEEIPEDITRRYMHKKTGRRQSTERSHKVRLVAIGSVAAAVVIIAATVAVLMTRSSAASTWANKIHAAIKLHSQTGLSDAQHYVDELQKNNQGMLKEPVVAAAVSDLQTQQLEFTSDAETLNVLIRKADEARKSAAGVVGNPAAPMKDVSTAAGTMQTALNDIQSAKDLSWVDSGNRLATASGALQTSLNTLRERAAAAARSEMDAIATAIEAIAVNPTTPEAASDARAKVVALSDRVNVLRDLPLLDDETKAAVSALAQKIVQRRQGADTSRSVAEELQNIRRNSDSFTALQTSLENFIKRFPNDPHTRGFAIAVQRLPMASALDDWQQVMFSLNNALTSGGLSAMQKRLDTVNAYLASHPGSPVGAAVQQYADYLRRGVEAMSDKGTWQNGFADLVSSPLISELAFMQVSDGSRYYVLGDVKRIERKMNNQVTSVQFDALDLKDFTKRRSITIESPLSVSDKPIPAPHVKLVSDIIESLKLINENNWEAYGIDLADRIVRARMDPVVKAILLQQTLKLENDVAGWALEETYDKTLAELARQTPDQLPWTDPAKITPGTVKALEKAFEEMPAAAMVKKRLAAAKTGLFKSLVYDIMGTGVLMKDDRGVWTVYSSATPLGGSMVWTLMPPAQPAGATAPATTSAPAPAPAPGNMLLIGTVVGSRYVLDEPALRTQPEGIIVYVTRP